MIQAEGTSWEGWKQVYGTARKEHNKDGLQGCHHSIVILFPLIMHLQISEMTCQYVAAFINTDCFHSEVLQVNQLSPLFLEFCLGKLIVPLTFCQLFLGFFSYARGGNSPHSLVHLASEEAGCLEADGLGICLAQSL